MDWQLVVLLSVLAVCITIGAISFEWIKFKIIENRTWYELRSREMRLEEDRFQYHKKMCYRGIDDELEDEFEENEQED